jgi:hypothetical protein
MFFNVINNQHEIHNCPTSYIYLSPITTLLVLVKYPITYIYVRFFLAFSPKIAPISLKD